VSVFGVVGGHGASGKNKCAAIVCRLLCVGFAALLFLRSVGCIIMVIVLVSVEVMNCRHSMTPYGQSLLLCWYFLMSSPVPLLIEKLLMKITTKADRIPSAGYGLIAICS